jgi:hypothetical protein
MVYTVSLFSLICCDMLYASCWLFPFFETVEWYELKYLPYEVITVPVLWDGKNNGTTRCCWKN